jgi:hypothetical protein
MPNEVAAPASKNKLKTSMTLPMENPLDGRKV